MENKRIRSFKGKHGLLLGLIVSCIGILVLLIGTGTSLYGLNWYREQATSVLAEKEQLQSSLSNTQSALADAQSELEKTHQQSAGDSAALQQRIEELEKQLGDLTKQLDEALHPKPPKDNAHPVINQTHFAANQKLVALSFDDGPGRYTERLLDELKSRNVRATFFVIGRQIADYRPVLRRMHEEGHVIGNHTFSHRHLNGLTIVEMDEEIRGTGDLVEEITGVRPTLLRPPGGKYDDTLLAYAYENNFSVINWTVDTLDWKNRDKQAVLDTAFQTGQYSIRDGAIILMHDLYASTVDAVVEMIDRLMADGYTLVTVPELIQARHGGQQVGRLYNSNSQIASTVPLS